MSLSFWNSINQSSSSATKDGSKSLEAKREAAKREQAARQAERDARLKASMETAKKEMEAAKQRRIEAQEAATIKKALGNDKVPMSREERRRLAIFQEDESDSRAAKRRPTAPGRKHATGSSKGRHAAPPALIALETRRDRRTIEEVEWDMKQRRAQVAAQSGHPIPSGSSSLSSQSKLGMTGSLGKMGSFKTGSSTALSGSKAPATAAPNKNSYKSSNGSQSSSSIAKGSSSKSSLPSSSSAQAQQKDSRRIDAARNKRKRAVSSDESEDDAPRRSHGRGKRPLEDRWEPPEAGEVDRDYIWKLMGANRGRSLARPVYSDEDDDEDSDDDMEAGIDEVLEEERRAERLAAREERREAERLRLHAEEKKKRLGK